MDQTYNKTIANSTNIVMMGCGWRNEDIDVRKITDLRKKEAAAMIN